MAVRYGSARDGNLKAINMRSAHVASEARAVKVVRRRLVLALTITAVASFQALGQRAPATPNEPWIPEHRTLERSLVSVSTHEVKLDEDHVYSLGELIDIAESNSPTTREAWNRAKLAAASVGIAESDLYPTIMVTAAGRDYVNPQLFGQSFALQDIGTFETAVHLTYTLVDFGTRRTEVTAEKARLVAANLSFNDEHLVLIRGVSQSYFALLEAKGLREAAEVSLSDAEVAEAAAQERRNNGLATVPEVLEAKAATAKANYELQSSLGAEQVETGHLAQAITASPLSALKVQALDQLKIPDNLDQSVRDAIDTAFKDRPDLQAEEARVRAAHAEVRHAYSSYYPSVSFEGSKGWLRAFGEQRGYPGLYGHTGTYDATIGLKWTVFDGLLRENRVKTAKAEEKSATEEVRNRQDEISDQVWTDYANAQTALRQSEAATALLTASKESYSAALESYKDGVRNFLDVLAAEDALAQARAIDVTARTNVLQSFSDLAFRTGDLLQNHPKGTNP